jgi:N-acetylmuramic acid 6-phosphate etherase
MPPSKWRSLPTEAINPRSHAVETLSTVDIVSLMLGEDRRMIAAVIGERARIAEGAELVASAVRDGGRVLFVGAGTSGRLGVLEAAEIPPTFGTRPRTVQAVMAGGRQAVFRAREGVEDDEREGLRALARLRPTTRDVTIGITASGVTPFVRGALTRARKAGARVVVVTCGPAAAMRDLADVVIAPRVGPEVIAGSTRLKAGTATKMVLNMLTTIAMIKVGKTYGNLMVDVQPGNAKLKDRARRLVCTVAGVDAARADELLRRSRWNVKAAIVMARTGATAVKAAARLKQAKGSLRAALGE